LNGSNAVLFCFIIPKITGSVREAVIRRSEAAEDPHYECFVVQESEAAQDPGQKPAV